MFRLNNEWDAVIGGEFKKEYYLNLREFLKAEYKNGRVFPPAGDIFNALRETLFSKVKVVIIGQDPYPGLGQAHGMAFSVKPGVPVPRSLANIFRELSEDVGAAAPDHGNLTYWAQQGVLLLNAVLTVREGEPNSHRGKGWEQFTDAVIASLGKREEPAVFLLWGKNAAEKREMIDEKRNLVLTAAHPSPLSAAKGFFGCRHFSRANEFLISHVKSPIDWQIKNLNK